MSHFTEIKVAFDQKYEKELVGALEEVFGEGNIEVHPEGEDLKTYNGVVNLGNSSGLGRTEKCHLVVRKAVQEKAIGHRMAINDAGYCRTDDGKYSVYLDAMGFNATLQGKVAQSYGLKVAEKKLKAEGYMTKRVQKEDGTIRLEARIYS